MSELFKNQSIAIENLPSIEEESFQGIEKAYKTFMLIRNGLLIFLVFIIVLMIHLFAESTFENWHFAIVYIALFVFSILSFVLVQLGFERKAYLLREHDVIYKTGYIIQKMTVIPQNRIQHIEIREGVLLRLFKLSKLVIYTAGGNASDLSISGINPEVAKQLKEFISKKIAEND